MNQTIINLEKRKHKVLSMRNQYKWNCDKEHDAYESTLKRFDDLLDRIVKVIKAEWDKYYKNQRKNIVIS